MLRVLAIAAVLCSAGAAAAGAPEGARQEALLHLLRQDCGSCHGLTLRGGLGPPLLPRSLRDKPEAALVEAILDGRPGTPMAPWRFAMSPDEAAWLVRQLKRGLKP